MKNKSNRFSPPKGGVRFNTRLSDIATNESLGAINDDQIKDKGSTTGTLTAATSESLCNVNNNTV